MPPARRKGREPQLRLRANRRTESRVHRRGPRIAMAMLAGRTCRRRRIIEAGVAGADGRYRFAIALDRRPRTRRQTIGRGRRPGIARPAGCSALRPPAMRTIKTRWWRMCARPSHTKHGVAAISRPRDRWPFCRCRTAAHPSCGAPRGPRRLVCAHSTLQAFGAASPRQAAECSATCRTHDAGGAVFRSSCSTPGVRAAAGGLARRRRPRGASAGRPGLESGSAGLRRACRCSRAGRTARLVRRAQTATPLRALAPQRESAGRGRLGWAGAPVFERESGAARCASGLECSRQTALHQAPAGAARPGIGRGRASEFILRADRASPHR